MLATESHVKRRISRLEYVIKKTRIGSCKSAGCATLGVMETVSVSSLPPLILLAYVNYANNFIDDEYKLTLGMCGLSLVCLGVMYSPYYRKIVHYFQSLASNEIKDALFYINKRKKYQSQLERLESIR